jgi:hypothetical protein
MEALMAAEAVRRHQDPHPYVPAGRPADGDSAMRKDRVEDAIKVVVKMKPGAAQKIAAE